MAAPRTFPAPAKVNLALAVGPPSESGRHPIASWMVTVDFADEVTITPLESNRVSRYAIVWHPEAPRRSEIDWPIVRDLAVRAHRALEMEMGRSLPAQIKVEKRIPVGGGLGGGSADAAATLRGLNELFKLGLSGDDLRAVARSLGSDVPFLVEGGSAVVAGEGERIEPAPAPADLALVLAFPPHACPTAAVYRAFDELGPGPWREEAVRRLAREGRVTPSGPFNDLAPAAAAVDPALERTLADVASLAEMPAHVSGSGSTVFLVCEHEVHAEALAGAIGERLNLPAIPARLHAGTPVAGP